MADYLDLTGLNESERNKLLSNGGVGSLLGSTMPYGAVPFAMAGNMPASSWANSAATMLGAPIDALKWGLQRAGVQRNLNGSPIADVPGGSDTWRGVFGSLSGAPTPTQQPPPQPQPIASPFGAYPTSNGPTPPQPQSPPQPQQQPLQQQGSLPQTSSPGELASFLGTPVWFVSHLLRKAGLPVPQDENVPLGIDSWQRLIDTYNKASASMPPVTLDDIITAARRPR